jgi:OOP family OmpA-OmpF porin
MKKLSVLMLATAAVWIMAAPVSAGERAGAFSVSPFVGGYTFDGVQHLETAPVFGLRLGYDLTKHFGVEAVGTYLATEGTRSKTSINAMSYRLDLLYNLMPDGPLVPYLAVGGGGITYGHGSNGLKIKNSTTDATVNAGFGLKYFVTDSIALRGDARQLFVLESPKSPKYNWEYTAGLTFLIGGKTAAAPAPVIPAPTSSLSATPASITKGEPSTLSWTSQDATTCEINQGIGQVSPQGSMTITPAADTAYFLSCSGPGGTSNSTANVAVAQPQPIAPLAPTSSLTVTPASIKKGESATLNWTSENTTNCDIQPGIGPVQPQGSMPITPLANTDYTLTCTGAGGTTSSAGNIQVVVPEKKERICIVLKIEFDTGKAVIKPKYHAEVGKVAEFMKKYPESNGVIEGHTDNVGGKEYNQKLSERRAASVRTYLVEKYGIASERLTSKGYGFSKPIATNKTKAGKQKNRRIEATFDCVIVTK